MNGLYGVESTQGFVGPWEEGFLYGSAGASFIKPKKSYRASK